MGSGVGMVEGPFQPYGKGGDLFIITLGDLIEVLHENVEGGQCAKNNQMFAQNMGMLVVGTMYLAMSAATPFNDLMILSWTTASG